MTKTIAIVNQKGGVGKTTTTINLAAALGQRGRRVLVLDLDPQASFSIYAGLDVRQLDEERRTLYFALVEDRPLEELIISADGFDVIASSVRQATAEARLVADPHWGPLSLKGLLKPIQDRYDVILIDCSPSLTKMTVNALSAANEVIIPVKTDLLSLMGMNDLFNTVFKVIETSNPDLRVSGIIPTLYNKGYSQDAQALESLSTFAKGGHIKVFEPISRSTAFDKSVAEFVPTVLSDPNNPGAQSYQRIAEFIYNN